MASNRQEYNLRSPAVKRLMREAQELKQPTEEYFAQPLDDNLFEWHFTVKGPSDSDFEAGYYHGRIVLPTEYPMKPPSIILLTPNGRFEINKKICLSISGHHPESWQPSWSIRTALLAIIGFMPTEGMGAIGSLDYSSPERKELALKSQSWSCPSCGLINCLLNDKSSSSKTEAETAAKREQQELAKQICFKGTEVDPKANTSKATGSDSATAAAPLNPLSNNNDVNTEAISEIEPVTTEQVSVSPTEISAETNLRHRSVDSRTQTPIEQAANEGGDANLASSGPRFSTCMIALLTVAIAFLIFRRVLFVH